MLCVTSYAAGRRGPHYKATTARHGGKGTNTMNSARYTPQKKKTLPQPLPNPSPLQNEDALPSEARLRMPLSLSFYCARIASMITKQEERVALVPHGLQSHTVHLPNTSKTRSVRGHPLSDRSRRRFFRASEHVHLYGVRALYAVALETVCTGLQSYRISPWVHYR